jgi:type I restriction enzyme R subunit
MTKSESITRTEMIDKQLASAGWDVKNPTQVVQEFDILVEKARDAHQPLSPYDGHQFSDYVLLGKDGKPLAVVEAKNLAKMQRLAESKQNNIVTTYKNNSVAN